MADGKHNYYLVNLGCAKNAVDAESMAQLLGRGGYSGVVVPDEASVLIVNTCGFIDAAKQESIQTLRELAETKRDDQLLIAAGCLAQRYGSVLSQEVPGSGWSDRHAALDGHPGSDQAVART